MKTIEAPYFSLVNRDTPLDRVSALLDGLQRMGIDHAPWPAYAYKPDASFVIAHADDCLFIKYYVYEKAVKADYRQTNEPVYKDSCVEFFIGFGEDRHYYNFEFNCIGTCLCGFGDGKHERRLLQQQVIEGIKRQTLIKKDREQNGPKVYWELTAAIPLEVFCYHQLSSLRGVQCGVNLYKCGDDLPNPHYLSWTNIISDEPNFHLSDFFGKMTFAY